MLEDDFNDVLGKAIRRLGISSSDLEISERSLSKLLAGEMNEDFIKKTAPLLNLNAEKLIQLKNYSPAVTAPDFLHTYVSPYGHLGVNAFVVETSSYLLIFDTGTDSEDLLKWISERSEKTALLYITHDHADHTAGVHEFKKREITVIYPENATDQVYDNFFFKCLDVAGHCSPATAYLLESSTLESPLCIVGDAVFAGSIGGCKSTHAYSIAIPNIKENLLTLPLDTILCSGHGPLTTVGQELENNPFF